MVTCLHSNNLVTTTTTKVTTTAPSTTEEPAIADDFIPQFVDEILTEYREEIIVTGVAGTTVLAATPAGLGTFGGAGFAGQPGIVLGGGGVLPAAVLTVKICINKTMCPIELIFIWMIIL